MSSQDGPAIASWSFKAIGVRGTGPVTEVPFNGFFLLGLHAGIAGDDGEGPKKETGGVGHDGGATRIDLVAGLELIEFAERVVDCDGVAEFLDVADENGSEVGLVQVSLMFGSVLGAEAGIGIGDGHAATASAGRALLTMGRSGSGDGDGCFGL
jgi:hypothetical protein